MPNVSNEVLSLQKKLKEILGELGQSTLNLPTDPVLLRRKISSSRLELENKKEEERKSREKKKAPSPFKPF